MWDNNSFTLIATKEYDAGVGPPYYPMWRETYLYKAEKPSIGKDGEELYYIYTAQLSIGGKWMNEDEAMKFVAESYVPRQRAPRY